MGLAVRSQSASLSVGCCVKAQVYVRDGHAQWSANAQRRSPERSGPKCLSREESCSGGGNERQEKATSLAISPLTTKTELTSTAW